MRVSLYINGVINPQSGYLPVSIDELSKMDSSSLQEIVVVDALDYFPNTSEILGLLASKLQYGGRLILESTNLNSVIRAYRYGELDSVQLNKLLYCGKQSVLSNTDVTSVLQSLGLSIVQQSLYQFKYSIVAQRPGV